MYCSMMKSQVYRAIATTSDDLKTDEQHSMICCNYKCKRLDIVSLLAAIDLQTGECIPLIRDKHSSKKYIEFLKLLDRKYPKGDILPPFLADLNLCLYQSMIHALTWLKAFSVK